MAFIFPKNYQSLSREEKADWNYLKKIFDRVSFDYKVSKASKPNLSGFETFNGQKSLKLLQSFNIRKDNNQFTLCLIEYNTSHLEAHSYGGTIRTNSHKYLFGHLKIDSDFGRAFLRPETIGDKISEFFSSNELDIKGFDKFNRNYHLLTSDKKKFLTAMNGQLINSIAELKNVEMEFSGKKCLFRLKKAIDLEETLELCKLGINMATVAKNNSA
ncbi:hypothetical protein GGR42_002519 [Saonia flava]|uniref:Uncharacterized protein n=1 Tax=Saonia flava TaxID=523696 RepID=A0A846QVK7_9FLAO|nr:hypothetical protein [Saonia flava]NJB72028.1 hypothetical protein [Saonia flava]